MERNCSTCEDCMCGCRGEDSNCCNENNYADWRGNSKNNNEVVLHCTEFGKGKKCIMRGCHLECGNSPCMISKNYN